MIQVLKKHKDNQSVFGNSKMPSRVTAEDLIAKGKLKEGYRLLSEWYTQKNRPDIALIYSLFAAKEGDPHSIERLGRYADRCEEEESVALIMAEGFYQAGMDKEGDAILRRADELGFKGALPGMMVRQSGPRKKITSERDVQMTLHSIRNIRLFREIAIDYSQLEPAHQKRFADVMTGFTYAKGYLMANDRVRQEIVISHWYKERLLVPILHPVGEKTIAIIGEDSGETNDSMALLLSGITVTVDYSKCLSSSSSQSFGLLTGVTQALDGKIMREKNIVTYIPCYREEL